MRSTEDADGRLMSQVGVLRRAAAAALSNLSLGTIMTPAGSVYERMYSHQLLLALVG